MTREEQDKLRRALYNAKFTTDAEDENPFVGIYFDDLLNIIHDFGQQHPQWIPVEKELPPKKDKYSKRSNEVLVITERKECFIAKYWYDGDGWAVSGFPTSKLTHWMEIVPPRNEE